MLVVAVLVALDPPPRSRAVPRTAVSSPGTGSATLDNARRNRIEPRPAATVDKPKIPPARSVTINGIVSRSDGESTIWVNGHPTEGQTEDGMRATISQFAVIGGGGAGERKASSPQGRSEADLISGNSGALRAAPGPGCTAPTLEPSAAVHADGQEGSAQETISHYARAARNERVKTRKTVTRRLPPMKRRRAMTLAGRLRAGHQKGLALLVLLALLGITAVVLIIRIARKRCGHQ